MTDTPNTVPQRSCLNCNQPLSADFCSFCGQEEKEVRRPFMHFLQELVRVVLELDGRAYRTLYSLITRPGFLTREYFAGRRVKFTPPLRLFLIVSIGFFLSITLVNALQSMQAALQGTPSGGELIISDAEPGDDGIVLSDEPLDDATFEDSFRETIDVFASLELPFFDDETNGNLQRALSTQLEENLREVMADPEDFLVGSLEYITFFMLLMMPILALIQQILWVFTKRYYVEHLVLTVHNHSFLILMILLSIMFGAIDDLAVPVVSTVFGWIAALSIAWIFLYLYLSLKNYFERGWLVTAAIFTATTIIYSVVLSMGMFVFAMMLVLFS